MGKLTTHVLDTANGCAAAHLNLTLWTVDRGNGEKALIVQAQTNLDGRTDRPLLDADGMSIGVYELVFEVGAYFTQQALALPKPLFLDRVPIQFGISDPDAHYHVPLLVSPWSYSTYRGS
jgi:5-hydroxyisourate hydrolase